MADSTKSGFQRRKLLRAILAAVAVLILVFVVPPLISVNHYKKQITNLIARSFGRPVRLSSVEVRLLPWPGFVLTDLSVAEDPAYGAEPVLHANKVTASIRLLALWRGRLEIGSISVDEASLNVVRTGPGSWNLDTLFRSAAAQSGPRSASRGRVSFPSLAATDSRIDFKDGVEKLPFSLVNTDLSVWQEGSGEWRIRLRGQPARTDVSLYQEDTGVVRMEATVGPAPSLRQMPTRLDLDWREAQLGQLARLVTGSDSGWRGDLTGNLHLEGTADAANVAIRLRATSVHREEFVPVSPLDFDANCTLVYHYTQKSLQNLVCDSPLGDGRIRLTGEKPGAEAPPRFTVELNRIPVAAALDALRTLRSGLQPDLEATGVVSGKIIYAESVPVPAPAAHARLTEHVHGASIKRQGIGATPSASGPLTGSLTVENLMLTGGGLTRPVQAPRITLAPVATAATIAEKSSARTPPAAPAPADALAGTVSIPAGGAVPLTLTMRFSLAGYEIAAHGQASIPRARELAHAAGIPETNALQDLAGDPLTVELIAAGPWIPAEVIPFGISPVVAPATPSTLAPAPPASSAAVPGSDTLTGTVTLHNANWRADFLSNHLQIAEATLHLEDSGLLWDPVSFTYGSVKGSATLQIPHGCAPQQPALLCPAQIPPTFTVVFDDLDAASFQTALLGARERSTLLSTLIDRIHPSAAPPWPQIQGAVTAGSLDLGPIKLQKISAAIKILPDGAEVSNLDAGLLGGQLHLSGTLHKPATDQDTPAYSFIGEFQNLDAKALGRLLGLRWTGSRVNGNGRVDLSGYTGADLAASAKGTLHIESRYGAVAAGGSVQADPSSKTNEIPPALTHFDRMTADATIGGGTVALGQNQLISAGRKRSVGATVNLTDPPTVSFESPQAGFARK
jgi:hypothetical protein